jgi:hypothetical protein
MTDIILYYQTKTKTDYVIANEGNIRERVAYAESNELFVEWSSEAKFNINLLLKNEKIN